MEPHPFESRQCSLHICTQDLEEAMYLLKNYSLYEIGDVLRKEDGSTEIGLPSLDNGDFYLDLDFVESTIPYVFCHGHSEAKDSYTFYTDSIFSSERAISHPEFVNWHEQVTLNQIYKTKLLLMGALHIQE